MRWRLARLLHERFGFHLLCRSRRVIDRWDAPLAATYLRPDGTTFTPDITGVSGGSWAVYRWEHC